MRKGDLVLIQFYHQGLWPKKVTQLGIYLQDIRFGDPRYSPSFPRCEIITRMIHTAPDVTRLIDRIEKLELVERAKSVHDGRLSVTYITMKGLDLLETLQAEIEALELQLSAVLTTQEATALTELCERVALSADSSQLD